MIYLNVVFEAYFWRFEYNTAIYMVSNFHERLFRIPILRASIIMILTKFLLNLSM